jgi:hypothetical protein
MVKGKAIPLQAWTGPEGSRRLRLPGFESVSGKVGSPTHQLPLPPRNIPGTYSCSRLSRPHGHSAAGRIMSLKTSSDTIGNGTCDLRAGSAVPKPTAPPHTPKNLYGRLQKSFTLFAEIV